MTDENRYYMYMILDKQEGRYIGQCSTREAAMEYAELLCDAGIPRSIDCNAAPLMDASDYPALLEDLKANIPEVLDREMFSVYGSALVKPLAVFYSVEHALEYCRLRTDSGKPSTVSPLKLSEPDVARDRLSFATAKKNGSSDQRSDFLTTHPVFILLGLLVICIATCSAFVWAIGSLLSIW